MHTPLPFTLARAATGFALALSCWAAHADVASLGFAGTLGFDQEVQTFDLDVSSTSDLRLWTTSYAGGQFDPALAFFDRVSGSLLSLSDDVDAPYALIDATQGLLDAGLRITDLAPGLYRVAVSASPNLPAGSTWAEGYLLGTSGGNVLGSGWAARLELSNAVPEPTPAALVALSLALLSWVSRRPRG